jgi:hypothetical protein
MSAENRMANQLSAMEELIKKYPEQEAALKEMHGDIASGNYMKTSPMRVGKPQGEDPKVTQKARQMKFLEELQMQYPDKSKDILTIKNDLAN